MTEFHFSPRPNRAADIDWMTWGDAAFARAVREDKPILLGISAVWCHWCHVMDETTYSDDAVIEAINRDFVAVRVDNDERPDVNSRYNMGGWPTTAFLAPNGSIVTGFTYVPASQMRGALEQIAQFYMENREQIAARDAAPAEASFPEDPPVYDLEASMAVHVAQNIASQYDREFGGFGAAPKFPQPEVLEFLLTRWRAHNDPHMYEMVAHTMREMSRGGMYDHIEGGFFRYSTTRDWSVPHFEKMAEDHAGLLRVLAQLQLWTPHADWRATLWATLRYVREVLRDPATAFFAGSQDADEVYFSLGLEERQARQAPFVDRRSYSNWTAALAGAFAWCASALDDSRLALEAAQTLDALHDRMRDGDGLLYHVAAPNEPPRIRGLLADQSAYLRALLDAHHHTGELRFLDRAIGHADVTIAHFGAQEGGFTDRAGGESVIGRLQLADRPIVENGLMAESLMRLATMTGEAHYRERAASTLAIYARTYERAGQFAATYARAVERYTSAELHVRVDGLPEQTGDFRETALRLPSPFACTSTHLRDGAPRAVVCYGTICAAPVDAPADLRAAYDSVIAG